MADLCQQYDVYIISDEIHRDIILPGAKLTALHSQPGLAERTVTVISPSKTFNMGGFHSATAIIPDPQLKAAVRQRLSDYGHSCGRPSLFSIVAQTAAYQHGGPWLDQLVAYLLGNFRIMLDKIKDLPLKASLPQATYMLWVDCQELGLDTDQLNALMLDQAAVQVELGHIYDSAEYMHYHGPQTHMRLNAAMPKSQIIQAMDGIRQAVLSVI